MANRYDGKVYRLCCSLLRDTSAAEDAAQESLLRVWKALPAYDGRAALSTWIYTITRNRCFTAIARNATVDVNAERRMLEGEHQMQLIELWQGYVRLQLSTLGTWIGAAFVCGVTITLAMPWLQATLGDYAVLVMPVAAGLFALAIGISTLAQRLGMPRWLS